MIPEALATPIFFLALSGVLIIVSGNWAIDAAKKIVHLFGWSGFTVGFVFLAVSTSLPELSVGISAGLLKEGGLVIGNVVGANISDILLVLGVSAVISHIYVRKKQFADYSQILFMVSLIPLIMLARGRIDFIAGLLLLVIFFIYIFFLTKTKAVAELENKHTKREQALGLVVFGLAIGVLILSANLFVSSAAEIAHLLGLPAAIIGLTVVALGTTTPELVLNINAMLKKEYAIAIGNILGSCVVNLTLVLGVSALLNPITVDFAVMGSSMIFLVIVCLLLWFLISRYDRLDRRIGLGFIALYLLFILSQVGILPLFL